MSTVIPAQFAARDSAGERPEERSPGTTPYISLRTTWSVLRFTYGLVPIVAGLDKFTNVLAAWENYLNPVILRFTPLSAHAFMEVVGGVEIAAGILTLLRPRAGGFVVMAWLVAIAFSLMTEGRYLDVAVRDLVMAIGAMTLANLTPAVNDSRRKS